MTADTSGLKATGSDARPTAAPAFAALTKVMNVVSGEWLLTWAKFPNGGTVIVVRTLYVTTLVYWPLIGLKHACEVGCFIGPHLTGLAFGQYIAPTIPWFGALFAGVYATLQTRYSSQWTYLADVYNRIKETATDKGHDKKAMAEWKAGFIEDAEDLHLIGKAMFRTVFHAWSGEKEVEEAFVEYTHNGTTRWSVLVRAYGRKEHPEADPSAATTRGDGGATSTAQGEKR